MIHAIKSMLHWYGAYLTCFVLVFSAQAMNKKIERSPEADKILQLFIGNSEEKKKEFLKEEQQGTPFKNILLKLNPKLFQEVLDNGLKGETNPKKIAELLTSLTFGDNNRKFYLIPLLAEQIEGLKKCTTIKTFLDVTERCKVIIDQLDRSLNITIFPIEKDCGSYATSISNGQNSGVVMMRNLLNGVRTFLEKKDFKNLINTYEKLSKYLDKPETLVLSWAFQLGQNLLENTQKFVQNCDENSILENNNKLALKDLSKDFSEKIKKTQFIEKFEEALNKFQKLKLEQIFNNLVEQQKEDNHKIKIAELLNKEKNLKKTEKKETKIKKEIAKKVLWPLQEFNIPFDNWPGLINNFFLLTSNKKKNLDVIEEENSNQKTFTFGEASFPSSLQPELNQLVVKNLVKSKLSVQAQNTMKTHVNMNNNDFFIKLASKPWGNGQRVIKKLSSNKNVTSLLSELNNLKNMTDATELPILCKNFDRVIQSSKLKLNNSFSVFNDFLSVVKPENPKVWDIKNFLEKIDEQPSVMKPYYNKALQLKDVKMDITGIFPSKLNNNITPEMIDESVTQEFGEEALKNPQVNLGNEIKKEIIMALEKNKK
jgi:hypothetical protein